MMRSEVATARTSFVLILVVLMAACGRSRPPIERPTPPPPAPGASAAARTPAPPEPVAEPVVVPPEPVPEERITSVSLDELNRSSPLAPVFFDYDSSELNATAQAALDANAAVLRKNATWAVTIEGHCDERGSAEYNLALGERRAVAARTYLVALGIPADRLRTVSYGKEFPFDPGRDEAAYAKNRRAHFVITGQ
jgi:peptidoglycan-associated lipoprotein